jgi:hypothetical protein
MQGRQAKTTYAKADKISLMVLRKCNNSIKCHGWVVGIPALYSGGPGLKTQTGDQLSCLRFDMVFFSPSKQMLIYDLKQSHDHFLCNSLFTIILSFNTI